MSEWKMVGKPALILIHMQHAITDEAGKVAFLGHAKATTESGIISKQQALLKAFRAKGLPVIYVNSVHPVDAAEKASPYSKFWNRVKNIHLNEAGTKDIEVRAGLEPQPGEPVIGNYPNSIFAGNTGGDLKQILDANSVDTLVLAGVATGQAVLGAVLCASDLFYNVIVPSDASTDANRSLHDVVMNTILPGKALVTTTDDVIAHLQRSYQHGRAT